MSLNIVWPICHITIAITIASISHLYPSIHLTICTDNCNSYDLTHDCRGEPLPANNLNNAFSAVAPTASDGTSVTASSAGAMSDPSPPGGTRPLLSADQFARLLRGENIGPARTPAQTDLNTVITADTIMSSGVLDDPAGKFLLLKY